MPEYDGTYTDLGEAFRAGQIKEAGWSEIQKSAEAPAAATGTIFYTRCQAGGLIYQRAAIYAKSIRDSDAYQWLYKKIAYADASVGNASLKTKPGGGLASKKNTDTLYTMPDLDDDIYGYSPGPRFLPKPHLVSVKTSYSGDFGSVQKCDIAFTVYSLDQLSAYQGFFQINQTLFANWGWEGAGPAGGAGMSFKGQIVNFSWSINADGGADCTSTAIGKGVNTLTTNANLPATPAGRAKTYQSGIVGDKKIKIVTTLIDELIAEATGPANTLTNGVASIPSAKLKEKYTGVEGFDKMSDPMTYCTLEKLVSVINAKFKEIGFSDIKYRIGSANEGGACKIPGSPRVKTYEWASANPLECVFPGLASYNPDGSAGEYAITDFQPFAPGATPSIGSILLNTFFLSSILEKLGTTTDKGEKSASKTLNDYFKKIFTAIDLNSGGTIKISTVTNPSNLKEILIIETQFIPKNITPVVIPAVSENSICRSMSLSAKIPSELTSAASVSATSSAGNVNSKGIKPFTKFNTKVILKGQTVDGATESPEDAKAAVEEKIAEDKGKQADITLQTNALQAQIDNLLQTQRTQSMGGGSDGFGGGSINSGITKATDVQIAALKEQIAENNETSTKLKDDIAKAEAALQSPITNIGQSGPTSENVTAARAFLKSISFDNNYSVVYPLDFSFTIDGIAGIKFGDAVTSNYMPQVYKKNSNRCAFTVLNVSHEISGGDWTTSCTTVFRVRP